MKNLWILLILAAGAGAQTPGPGAANGAAGAVLDAKQAEQLATRMLQLVESTAVAVPGLIRASEPVKQNAQLTFSALQRTPRSPALIYQLINQVKAYLALADSIPRPYPFPPTADQQFSELREGLQRLQQHFEGLLRIENLDTQKTVTDPNELEHFTEANRKTPAPGALPRVVFLGDETTEVWRLNEYFTGRDFINRGITGQTTQQMLGRFRQDVTGLKPKVVMILAGSADVAAGVAPNQTEDNLAMMADLAKAEGIRAVFGSILPVSDYNKADNPKYDVIRTRPPAAINALNRWLENYCANPAAGCIYVNYYPGLADTAGLMQASFSDDGLTPNAKGLRVMSPTALAAIERAIATPGDDAAGDPLKRRPRAPGK